MYLHNCVPHRRAPAAAAESPGASGQVGHGALVRGKGVDRAAGHAMGKNPELVGFHYVAPIRIKNEPLITPATFGAAIAGHVRGFIRQQSPL